MADLCSWQAAVNPREPVLVLLYGLFYLITLNKKVKPFPCGHLESVTQQQGRRQEGKSWFI